eukprot:Gb_08464 [translate_table: standard]
MLLSLAGRCITIFVPLLLSALLPDFPFVIFASSCVCLCDNLELFLLLCPLILFLPLKLPPEGVLFNTVFWTASSTDISALPELIIFGRV